MLNYGNFTFFYIFINSLILCGIFSQYFFTYSHFELFVPLCSLTTIEGEDRTEVKIILASQLLYQVGGSTVVRLAGYFGQAGQAGLTLPASSWITGRQLDFKYGIWNCRLLRRVEDVQEQLAAAFREGRLLRLVTFMSRGRLFVTAAAPAGVRLSRVRMKCIPKDCNEKLLNS